jgi:hypothetical protein
MQRGSVGFSIVGDTSFMSTLKHPNLFSYLNSMKLAILQIVNYY